MPSDALLSAGRQWLEKGLAVVPILLALATLFVALMQVLNGMALATVVRTLLVGWVLATPAAALLLWSTPDFVPDLDVGLSGDGASKSNTEDDPVQELRDRFARGELTQEAFESKLDRLLETEDATAAETVSRDRELERE